MSGRRLGFKSSVCAWALCAAVAGVAGAAPKETHKLGVEALETGRWAEAERFFRAAAAERSQEKVNRFLGTTYLPHYYLGVALAEQKRCQAALGAWAESERQGQIQKSDLAADLERRRQGCRDHLRRVSDAKAEVEQLLDRGEKAAASLATLAETPELAPLWKSGSRSFAARQKSATDKLFQARQRTGERGAAGELERLGQAKSLAATAVAELDATLGDARRRLGELNAASAAALEQLEEIEQSARGFLRSISDLAPYPRRLGARIATVERLLAQVRDSKSGASARRLSELGAELTEAEQALRRAARRPPRQLSRAVEAFLAGSYAEALELLDASGLDGNARARPHVCLIRAASGHALWVLGGEQDEALRELAIESITGCAGDEPAEVSPPSSRFFSPRFVDFHRATLESLARAAELEAAGAEGSPGVAERSGGDAATSVDRTTDDGSGDAAGAGA